MKPDLSEQHARLKSRYPGVVLLPPVADFCEAFGGDADTIARVLSLPLTTHGGHRTAGFPYMQFDRYLMAPVMASFRVTTVEPALDKPCPGKLAVTRCKSQAEKEG